MYLFIFVDNQSLGLRYTLRADKADLKPNRTKIDDLKFERIFYKTVSST